MEKFCGFFTFFDQKRSGFRMTLDRTRPPAEGVEPQINTDKVVWMPRWPVCPLEAGMERQMNTVGQAFQPAN